MTEKFVITGMTCAACAAHVEKAASSLAGVDSAAVNLMLGTLVCYYGRGQGLAAAIIAAVDGGGLRRGAGGARPGGTAAEQDAAARPWAAGCCGRWCVLCPCSTSAWVT